MASISGPLKNIGNVLQKCKRTANIAQTLRPICTSQMLRKDEGQDDSAPPAEKVGWFKNLLQVRSIAPSKESHSAQLSKKETLYEWQLHCVKPEYMETYLKDYEIFQQLMHNKGTGAKLIGSFTVEVGDQDQAIHIWSYEGGYPVLNNATYTYRTDKEFIEYRKTRNTMLRSRRNQILLPFSFWPEPLPREGNHIYEMRTYTLKAGTMIEWANNWSRGLQHRKDSNPVTGMFSQIGELYQVHHVWCYDSLQHRMETRENAWSKPGWDDVVAYTVPLIRHMESRILIPTPFSPLQ